MAIISVLDDYTESISNVTTKLMSLFDNGLSLYKSVSEQVKAIENIDSETVTENVDVTVAPSTATEKASAFFSSDTGGINNTVLFAGAGLLLMAILLRR